MTQKIIVSKVGVNALIATAPNDFIFHSNYNTLKIIGTGLVNFTLPAGSGITDYTLAHNKSYTPFIVGFVRYDTFTAVISPDNQSDDLLNNPGGFTVLADATNIIFRFANAGGAAVIAHCRYYIFEIPL